MRELLNALEQRDVRGVRSSVRSSSVNERCINGFLPLCRAACIPDSASFELCEALLQEGADVQGVDFLGWTALHWACSAGNLSVVELLLWHGADMHYRTPQGHTCLDLAFQSSQGLVIRFFLLNHRELFTSLAPILRGALWRVGTFIGSLEREKSWKLRFLVVNPNIGCLILWRQAFPGKAVAASELEIVCLENVVSVRIHASESPPVISLVHLESRESGLVAKKQTLLVRPQEKAQTFKLYRFIRRAGLKFQTLAAVEVQAVFRAFLSRRRSNGMISSTSSSSVYSSLLNRSVSNDSQSSSKKPLRKREKVKQFLTRGLSSKMLLGSSKKLLPPEDLENPRFPVTLAPLIQRSSSTASSSSSTTSVSVLTTSNFGVGGDSVSFTVRVKPELDWSHSELEKLSFRFEEQCVQLAPLSRPTTSTTSTSSRTFPFTSLVSCLDLSAVKGEAGYIILSFTNACLHLLCLSQESAERLRRQFLKVVPKPTWAALVLQCIVRGWLARKKVRSLMKTKESKHAQQDNDSDVWVTAVDPKTRITYYYNKAQRRSTWNPPEWVRSFDPTQQRYFFFNTRTNQSLWTLPDPHGNGDVPFQQEQVHREEEEEEEEEASLNAVVDNDLFLQLLCSHLSILLHKPIAIDNIQDQLTSGPLLFELANTLYPHAIWKDSFAQEADTDLHRRDNLTLVLNTAISLSPHIAAFLDPATVTNIVDSLDFAEAAWILTQDLHCRVIHTAKRLRLEQMTPLFGAFLRLAKEPFTNGLSFLDALEESIGIRQNEQEWDVKKRVDHCAECLRSFNCTLYAAEASVLENAALEDKRGFRSAVLAWLFLSQMPQLHLQCLSRIRNDSQDDEEDACCLAWVNWQLRNSGNESTTTTLRSTQKPLGDIKECSHVTLLVLGESVGIRVDWDRVNLEPKGKAQVQSNAFYLHTVLKDLLAYSLRPVDLLSLHAPSVRVCVKALYLYQLSQQLCLSTQQNLETVILFQVQRHWQDDATVPLSMRESSALSGQSLATLCNLAAWSDQESNYIRVLSLLRLKGNRVFLSVRQCLQPVNNHKSALWLLACHCVLLMRETK